MCFLKNVTKEWCKGMNSYKKLINNSFIFAIGTLGSKLVSFLLVPLYTYYLAASEYGAIDLTITSVNMLLPIASASIFEAVLRFVLDSNKDKEHSIEAVLSNSILIAFTGFFLSLALYPLLNNLGISKGDLFYLYIILLVQIFERVYAQYTRAIGKVKIFALNGILLTFTMGILNILFLVYFGLGVRGYYLAMIIANIISIFFLFMATSAYKNISLIYINSATIKKLLVYSVPLVPNSLMWWLINASSRYFIRGFVGISANGLFAVASRIPSLINIVNQVFSQAWQLSAIEEYKNKNKSVFYSVVFKNLSAVMFLTTSAIIVVVKPIFENLFASEYYSSWQVVPFLLLGTVFSSFSGFLGTNYIAAKETKGVFKTSIYGGIISLILNTALIPTFGIIGAGVSSMMSFFFMYLIRLYDTREYVNIEIDWGLFSADLLLILIQTGILFANLSMGTEFILQLLLFGFILIINRELFLTGIKIYKNTRKYK